MRLWFGIYATPIAPLEGVQRRFAKSSSFLLMVSTHQLDSHTTNYWYVSTLVFEIRFVIQVAFLYKVLHSILGSANILNYLHTNTPRTLARQNNIFYLPTARTNILIASPVYQIISKYSSIEKYIDNFFCTISDIKRIMYK